jgi:hypothetical protein
MWDFRNSSGGVAGAAVVQCSAVYACNMAMHSVIYLTNHARSKAKVA